RRLETLTEAVTNSDLAVGLADKDGDGQLRQLHCAFGRDLADARIADRRCHLGAGGDSDALGAVGIERLGGWCGLAHKQAGVGEVPGGGFVWGGGGAAARAWRPVGVLGTR